jgi:hypothetical protein
MEKKIIWQKIGKSTQREIRKFREAKGAGH